GGVQVRGPETIAVRPISRIPKTVDDSKPISLESLANRNASLAIDDGAVIRLSRKILETSPAQRGALYLERALLLAHAGAERAAYEDAGAAKRHGATGKRAEDPFVLVRRALRVNPPRPFTLPPGVQAYGVEPDFEGGAKRCGGSTGPRAALSEAIGKLAALSG